MLQVYQLWRCSQPSFSEKIKPPHTSMSSKACIRHYWETQPIDELHLISRVESVKGSIDYRGEYPDLFHGLGKMEGPCKSALNDDAQPFAINVPRRVALPLMDKTKKELRRMEDAGVIVRVEQPTDWCAPMVVVPKKYDVRICVDLGN